MHIEDSDRLSYHFVTNDDADFLWEIDQDESVMRFINGGKKTSREDIDNIMLPRLQAYANFAFGWGIWRVQELSSGENIGWVLVRPFGFFTNDPQCDNLELGWRFKRKSWGNGFATEAAAAVKQALQELGTETFSAIADPENTASSRVMKKLGMEYLHDLDYKDALYEGKVAVYSTERN